MHNYGKQKNANDKYTSATIMIHNRTLYQQNQQEEDTIIQVQIQTEAAAHKRHNTRQQPFNITDSSVHLHLHEPAVPAEPEDV